jgi:hypothetical protein
MAIPIHGGHHIVDLFGGLVVAAIAIVMARATIAVAARGGRAHTVAEPQLFAARN